MFTNSPYRQHSDKYMLSFAGDIHIGGNVHTGRNFTHLNINIIEGFLCTKPFARMSYVVSYNIVCFWPSHEKLCRGRLSLINVLIGGAYTIHIYSRFALWMSVYNISRKLLILFRYGLWNKKSFILTIINDILDEPARPDPTRPWCSSTGINVYRLTSYSLRL